MLELSRKIGVGLALSPDILCALSLIYSGVAFNLKHRRALVFLASVFYHNELLVGCVISICMPEAACRAKGST